jgi:hypothetical protein
MTEHRNVARNHWCLVKLRSGEQLVDRFVASRSKFIVLAVAGRISRRKILNLSPIGKHVVNVLTE